MSRTDRAITTALLRDMIAANRFPLSPRIRELKAILAKLEPPMASAVVYPAPKPPGETYMALAKKRGR